MPYIQYCGGCNMQLLIEYPSEGGPSEGELVCCQTCGHEFQVRWSAQPGAKGSSPIEKVVWAFKSTLSLRGVLASYWASALVLVITFMAGALLGDRLFWIFGLLVRKVLRMAGVF